MKWRWDQGRLDYFRYESLVRIARVLRDFEHVDLREKGADPLRAELEARTGLPFAPEHYRVWRNYGRVFACALLATQIDGKLAVTDICRNLVGEGDGILAADEYLSLFARRFAYPFPAFSEYNVDEKQVFPLCAVVKWLLARHAVNAEASVGLDDVFAFVVGNGCTGAEGVEHYISLNTTDRRAVGDERRQVRELLIFFSQMNLFKWFGNTLYLDLAPEDEESHKLLLDLATPDVAPPEASPQAQLLKLGAVGEADMVKTPVPVRETPADLVFTEGRKVRGSHLRTERSPHLRRAFFESRRPPVLCDMCTVDLSLRYPWTGDSKATMLELHHILPLSSAIAIDMKGTSLADVEPVCPNCHKGVHLYYGKYFKQTTQADFASRAEARNVYAQAKRAIVA